MSLQVGAVLSGAKWRYRLVERLGDHTVFSSVFKAEVLPGIQRTTPVKLAVVKTTDPNNPVKRNSLLRELHYYGRPAIISCPSIRKMYDTVNSPSNWTAENPFCLALEWMESTFADVPSVIPLQSPVLAQTIMKAALQAFAALSNEGLVYSDLKPSNVLLSGIDGPLPQAKIGDLGLIGPEGCNKGWLQPLAFRAPEVWTSVSCLHVSDVWSLAALILEWLDSDLLGNHDNNGCYPQMTWCLAKIMRFFTTSNDRVVPPPKAHKELSHYFHLAEKLLQERHRDMPDQYILETPRYEQWAAVGEEFQLVPRVVVNMIRYLAVLDPTRRPTAAQALMSNEFKALDAAASVYKTKQAIP